MSWSPLKPSFWEGGLVSDSEGCPVLPNGAAYFWVGLLGWLHQSWGCGGEGGPAPGDTGDAAAWDTQPQLGGLCRAAAGLAWDTSAFKKL